MDFRKLSIQMMISLPIKVFLLLLLMYSTIVVQGEPVELVWVVVKG